MSRHVYRVSPTAILIVSILVTTSQAQAANLQVSTFGDDLTVNGNCTLREAIDSVQTNTDVDNCVGVDATTDTIELGVGRYILEIAATDNENNNDNGDFDIDTTVIIVGQGASMTTIDAEGVDRIFHVQGGHFLTLRDLTLTGGAEYINTSSGGGGAIRTSQNSRLEMYDVYVFANTSASSGGGLINFNGDAYIYNSEFRENVGNSGGGIMSINSLAYLFVSNTTIIDNEATFDGGGMVVSRSPALITNSTIAFNHAGDDGGGIWLSETAGFVPDLQLYNSTVVHNRADSTGGAIDDGANEATVKIGHSTIARNSQASQAAIRLANVESSLTIFGSIIAENEAEDCRLANGATFTSDGYNVLGVLVDGCTAIDETDLEVDWVGFQDVGDYGGPTSTMPLAATSPAIDLVSIAVLGCLPFDQRGIARPQGQKCDAGAVEFYDSDQDGHVDPLDNCLAVPNAEQEDNDNDGDGDACDNDDDNDGIEDVNDNCPFGANTDQANSDDDENGDACDDDDDNDGIEDINDNCPVDSNSGQTDADGDGSGAACDPDDSGTSGNPVDDDASDAATDTATTATTIETTGGGGCSVTTDGEGDFGAWLLVLGISIMARRWRPQSYFPPVSGRSE